MQKDQQCAHLSTITLASGGILILLALCLSGCTGHVLDVDVAQERLDTATRPLDGSLTITQSFVCHRPNLCEIELLPAIYETPGQGTVTLRLCSVRDHDEFARVSINVAETDHNVPVVFAFPPQGDSAGKAYELCLEGGPGVSVGFWYNSVNAYGDGALRLTEHTDAGDLRFITRCRYDMPAMIQQAGAMVRDDAGLVIPLVVLLLLPGFALWHGLGLTKHGSPVGDLALTLSLSLALVPVTLLWSTVLGVAWNRSLFLAASAAVTIFILLRLLRTRFSDLAPWSTAGNRRVAWGAMALFFLTLLVRFAQIRNLALPAWVDSPQHTLVTQLLIAHGQVPSSYEPLLPVERFFYHFGFHSVLALFHWLSGLAIPQAMLVLGQVLSAAHALAAYLLTLRLTGRKLAAIVAELIVGLVSYLPAYYVTWGRYTQLTGLLLLPAALVTAMDWLEAERRDWRLLLVAGLMQAGLFMTHSRVTIYGACFLVAYLLCDSITHLQRSAKEQTAETLRRLALLAILAVGLSGPWVVQVVSDISAALREAGRSLSGTPSYNAVPWNLLLIARNRELMAVAALGAVWGLLRRKRAAALMVTWCGLVVLVLNPGWLGLAATDLVNNATAIISLFLPLSVLCGLAAALAWDRIRPVLLGLIQRLRLPNAATLVRFALAILITAAAFQGVAGTLTIINPITVLATAEDQQAMSWIRQNTPPTAVFLINVRHWQLGTYAGTDGGYWIPQLTGRRVLLPAFSYTYGAPDYVQHIAATAKIVSEVTDAEDPRLLDILERERVTHVYIGAKGGRLTPGMLLRSSLYHPAYSSGGVWIFEITRPNRTSLTM